MTNTKTVLTIALVAAAITTVALADEIEEMMQQLHSTCQGETGVDEGVWKEASKGNFQDDPKLKCYMKCIFVQTASMSDDGTLDAETLIAMLPDSLKEDGSKVIGACKNEKGSDGCETAFLVNKCMYKENPAKYILV